MKRKRLLLVAVASAALGCGDNSRLCDPATTKDMNGICVGGGVCANGTMPDADGNCVIDPSSCQDGTILVDGACVDPGRVMVDVEEAAEPNGLRVFGEDSDASAGVITLKPVGETTVVHGKIIPFRDLKGAGGDPVPDGQDDADVDTYNLDVTGPVLIEVTSDGLHGLAAGFVSLAVVGQNDPLAQWARFGINLSGDTSKRQIYLPTAGSYVLAVADTRTLFLTGGAAGSLDESLPFEYYVSIKQQMATPEPLAFANNVATSAGDLQPGEVKLFSAVMGEGIGQAELVETVEQAQESLVITNTRGATTTTKSLGDGDPGDGAPATAFVLGFQAGDQTILVADHVFDYALQPVHYDLTVSTSSAGALCNAATSTCPADADQAGELVDLSGTPHPTAVFSYDAGADLEITGMDLAFTDDQDNPLPVSGVIVDEDGFVFSLFTFDPDFAFQDELTFQRYRGLLRHPVAGRYYFIVFDPSDSVTTIRAKSTYQAVATVAITKGTPTGNTAPNAFASNPFTYVADAGTDPWQQFTGSGANSGNLALAWFDPANANRFTPGFGFGRLDDLPGSGCVVGSTDFCADVEPLFTSTFPQAGATQGRIVLADNVPTYLLTAHTATVAANTTFDLTFARRPHTDLGTVAVGTPVTADNQVLDGTTATIQRYLMRTAAGNGLAVTITPDQGVPALNTRGQQVNADESPRGALVNTGGVGAPDVMQIIQGNELFTAITVTAAAPSVGGTFDLAVDASAPVTYTVTTGTTAFDDACANGGLPVVLSGGADDGSSGPINTPAGFRLFGFTSPQIKVFANGLASVDAAASGTFITNRSLPSSLAPGGAIAPYWDDLVTDTVNGVCQKTVGTKLVIQWTGQTFTGGNAVQFQMILDGATSTIELVYAAGHVPTGGSATIGLQNQVASAANQLGFNTAGVITPGASKLFTPN